MPNLILWGDIEDTPFAYALMGLGVFMIIVTSMHIYDLHQRTLPPTLQCPFVYPPPFEYPLPKPAPVPKPAPRCINDITEFCT